VSGDRKALDYDAVIIGAGHNGLVAAAYLARAGLSVQVFERRVLTYTASNDSAFQVEMGNIGQHYYQWRYGFSTSPSTARWTDVTPAQSVFSGDPILFTDLHTHRTFSSDLLAAGAGAGCSIAAFTDDDGGNWSPSSGCTIPAGGDHQSLGGGPYSANSPPIVRVGSYPNAVYYCAQGQATALCGRSDDGGLTFGAGVPLYTLTQCTTIHGHIKVSPDGTVYVDGRSYWRGCTVRAITPDGIERKVAGGSCSYVVAGDNGAAGAGAHGPGRQEGFSCAACFQHRPEIQECGFPPYRTGRNLGARQD